MSLCCALVVIEALARRSWDGFLAGTWHGLPGYDFYSIPSSFKNLVSGEGIFKHKMTVNYQGSNFAYHPLVAILLGAPLSLLQPSTAIWVYISVSTTLLTIGARRILSAARGLIGPLELPPILICTLPVYLCLWNGQIHILTVLSFAWVLSELYTATETEYPPSLGLFLAGLLTCLFSKPLILLAVPGLLLVPKFRKPLLVSALIYCAVSVAFLFIPALNPDHHFFEGQLMDGIKLQPSLHGWDSPDFPGIADNWLHWYRIFYFLFRDTTGLGIQLPEFMSLPVFVADILHTTQYYTQFLVLPILVGIVGSFALSLQHQRKTLGKDFPMLLVWLGLFSFFLSYPIVWEYHYATLQVLTPFVLISLRSPSQRLIPRWALVVILLAQLSLFLPTPYRWLSSNGPPERTLIRAFRVVPVLVSYCLVFIFLCRDLLRAKRNHLAKPQ